MNEIHIIIIVIIIVFKCMRKSEIEKYAFSKFEEPHLNAGLHRFHCLRCVLVVENLDAKSTNTPKRKENGTEKKSCTLFIHKRD